MKSERRDPEEVANAMKKLKCRADYTVHCNSTLSTVDNSDHAFFGIMFDVEARVEIPIEHLVITSVWVRGNLGDVSVYFAERSFSRIYHEESFWTKVFNGKLPKSNEKFVELTLSSPIIIPAGKKFGIYVHSVSSSVAIIYDDQRNPITFENCFLKVHAGQACVSKIPFGPCEDSQMNYGWPWRPNREFVGQLSYGVRLLLWRPIKSLNAQFSCKFRTCSLELLRCLRSGKCQGKWLPKEIVYGIINMLRFDWFDSIKNKPFQLKDVRRAKTEGQAIGWNTGDWHVYQRMIFEHRLEFQRRTGVLVDLHEAEWTDDDEADEDWTSD